jgi:hypothetical protein
MVNNSVVKNSTEAAKTRSAPALGRRPKNGSASEKAQSNAGTSTLAKQTQAKKPLSKKQRKSMKKTASKLQQKRVFGNSPSQDDTRVDLDCVAENRPSPRNLIDELMAGGGSVDGYSAYGSDMARSLVHGTPPLTPALSHALVETVIKLLDEPALIDSATPAQHMILRSHATRHSVTIGAERNAPDRHTGTSKHARARDSAAVPPAAQRYPFDDDKVGKISDKNLKVFLK